VITQSALSREYVSAAVTAKAAGTPVNPTSDTVEFAFTTVTAKPASGDWKTGSWDGTQPQTPGNAYIAHCLVGPGGTVELPAGRYTMWVRITDSPEVPVIPFGLLHIT
jgi:broad specificity phosphatase PhoE